MSRRGLFFGAFLVALLLPSGAFAEVAVRVAPSAELDIDALTEGLGEELGVAVGAIDPESTGARDDVGENETLVVIERDPSGELVVTVLHPDGRGVERRVAGDTPPESLALLVSNLVRDESAELLALLRVEAIAEATDVPEAHAEADAEPEPPSEPGPPPPPTLAPEAPLSFGVDFVPGLGVSTATLGQDRRALSLGVLGGWSGAVYGVALSSLLDVIGGDLTGVQLSGLVGASGGDVRGAQLAGILAVGAGDVYGAQLSLIDVGAGALDGLQLGLVTVAGGASQGAQVGLTTVTGEGLVGAQIGLVNIAGGDVHGAQVGLVNIAGGRVHGLQLGLVNVSERADAPIGLASVQHGGEFEVRLGVDTNGFFGASLIHGSGVFRSILSAVVDPFLDRVLGGPGLGLGLRATLDPAVWMDFEAVVHGLFGDDIRQLGADLLADVRVVASFELVDHFGLYASLGARFQYSQVRTPELGAPFLETDFGAGDASTRLWPTLGAGVVLY